MRSGWTSSAVRVGIYTMNFGTLAMPTFSPAPGTYGNDVTLTLTAMAGATVRYTTTGQTVTSSSPLYSAPLTLSSATTVNARAYHPDYTSSAQASGGVHVRGRDADAVAHQRQLRGRPCHHRVHGNGRRRAALHADWRDPHHVRPDGARGYHSLAVDTDGGVWAWGMNSSGQLGDGTTMNRLTPVQIAGAGMAWKVPAPVLSVPFGVYAIEQTVVVTGSDPRRCCTTPSTARLPARAHPWSPPAAASASRRPRC